MSIALLVPITALLFYTWLNDRRERTLIWWSGSFLAFSAAGALYLSRDWIPANITVDVANGLLLIGMGLGLAAARAFNGRSTPLVAIFLGAGIWVAGSQFRLLDESLSVRVAGLAILLTGYVLALATEYWRGRGDGLRARYMIVATCVALVAFFGFHWAADAAGLVQFGGDIDRSNIWLALSVLAATVVAVTNIVLVIGMAKERGEIEQRRIAEIDPLTGSLTRRAALEEISTRLHPGSAKGGVGAALLFDLDFFKSINDTYGHSAGDEVLRKFASVSQSVLRSTDTFGRLGGEEFVAFLPGANEKAAIAVAERIRTAFSNECVVKDGICIPATVSVGIAVAEGGQIEIGALIEEADKALYAAKSNGRDRVQFSVAQAA
jgi:diguanylate cyclase (GGDEF)-like protein